MAKVSILLVLVIVGMVSIGTTEGARKHPWRIHTLFSVECQNYFDWQTVGLMNSYKKAKQPGPITRLLSCTDEEKKNYKGMHLAPTFEVPSMSRHPRTGDWWSKIATHFPGRTDNEIKNHWNTRIKKRVKLLGLVDPMTQKPIIEQKVNSDDDKNKIGLQQNTSEGCEEGVENKFLDIHGIEEMPKTEEKREENKVTWDDPKGVSNNYEMLCSQLDMGLWMSQETKTNTSSYCSSSFSLDDSSNLSIGESHYLQENSLQQWVDDLDSILSWDSFSPLEKDLFFMENRQ